MIAVKLWRLLSDYGDYCLIVEIAVWLWRLQSGISGMREISEQKANALNFWNPFFSTNQRPQFWAPNQWEASISGPPILTHFQNQTAISAIRLQTQQLDCNLTNQTAISTIELQSSQSDSNAGGLQYDCWDCSLIAEIAVWFWRWVKIGGPEIEASHWLRALNRGLWLVERRGFKKLKALDFRS